MRPERIMRVRIAAIAVPSVSAGSSRCAAPPRPDTGSQPSWMEKTIINSGPSQKFGIARPNKEKTSAKRSAAAPRCVAARTLSGKAIRSEIALRQAGEELDVLGEQGLVEPQLARERGFVGARRCLAEHRLDGIAGNDVDQNKDERDRSEERRQ